ncbi:AAA family ATPase [Halanaerobiaceae bacterium Z-7014]|uniref:AAA family ATPase n=1 Tax=Halonatronomonas betaini TaxID=2778430 RepID=A0A931AQR7_9FIRM|nr:LuxR C-terminal-related transcriptional regulator [Halonatronomonas betaini]MBF8436339.1 AAA family ATPase [Halonatronomonas betaini]
MNKFILKDRINPPLIQSSVEKFELYDEISRSLELDRGFYRNLTLIIAPAGYGKTTTLVNYYNRIDRAGCWLSLSEEDNSISRFLKDFFNTINQSLDNLVIDPEKYFQAAGSNPADKILKNAKELIADFYKQIEAEDINLYIFIDELEAISSSELNALFIYLIENLPAGLHIVAASREEPDWPLIRWKGRGKAKIFDQEQLIFNSDEIKRYMAENNLKISAYEAEIIYRITEGWITGIQFISLMPDLSVKRLKEKAFKVARVEMVDFLLEEIFYQQSEEVKDILLKTAPLKNFNLELVSYVTGYQREKVEEMIGLIYKKQLFLKVIDSKDESQDYWYSYHQIFTDGIIKVMGQTESDLIKSIHSKAADWYLDKGLIGEAVQELVKARDFDRAASVIFMESGELFRLGLQTSILNWFKKFPEEMLTDDPRLITIKVILELFQGYLVNVEPKLKVLEDLTGAGSFDNCSEFENKRLAGVVAVASIVYRIFSGQRSNIEKYYKIVNQNLDLSSYWRQLATIYHGDNQSYFGKLDDALKSYRSIRLSNRGEYNFFVGLAGLKELVQLWWQGRLNEARHLTKELLYMAAQAGFNRSPRFGSIQAIYGDLFCEGNELTRAIELIESGYKNNEEKGEVLGQQLVLMYKVRYLFSKREFEELEILFYKIESMMKEKSFSKLHDNLSGWKARFLLEQDGATNNHWLEAVELLNSRGITIDSEPVITQEMEYLALARAYLAGGRLEEAEEFSYKILKQCKKYKVYRHELESYLILANIHYQQGDKTKALLLAEDAVKLARRYGFFRFIVDEGRVIGEILHKLNLKEEYKDQFIDRLIQEILYKEPDLSESIVSNRKETELIEPLSDREIEILVEIAAGYSNKKIADRLAISPGTVRWHSSNIYGKLGVGNRTEAVARGQELGFI